MPTAPPRQCVIAGCPEAAVIRGRCRAHAGTFYRNRERQRGTAKQRGYDADWRRVRETVLRRDMHMCRLCNEQAATEVDHITPLSAGGDRLALGNLRAVCATCHRERHAAEWRQ